MLIDHTPRKCEGGTPRNAFILKNTKKDEDIAETLQGTEQPCFMVRLGLRIAQHSTEDEPRSGQANYSNQRGIAKI